MRAQFASLLVGILCLSCGGGTATQLTTPVASVSLSQSTATLAPAATLQLTASPRDAGGNALSGRTIIWSTTSASVATVNGGLVTAVSAGSATITATTEGQTASAVITVNAPVASVTLSRDTATLVAAGTITLVATTKDAGGNTLAGRAVTWGSSANTVATVSGVGVVTGAAIGTAVITATSETKSATVTITVKAGALIGAAGGIFTTADGKATVVIPAGALTQTLAITITPATSSIVDPLAVAGTVYEFGPSGTQFAQPVTVKLKYDPTMTVAGAPQGGLRVRVDSAGNWVPLGIAIVDSIAHVVQSTTIHFSLLDLGYPTILYREYGSGQDFSQLVDVCPNASKPITFGGTGGAANGSYSFASVNSSIANVIRTGTFEITISGLTPGTTDIQGRSGTSGQFSGILHVNVWPVGDSHCTAVPFIVTEDVTGSPAIKLYRSGTTMTVPTTGVARGPAFLDLPGLVNKLLPLAYSDATARTLNVFFNGTDNVPTTFTLNSGAWQGGFFPSATKMIGAVQNISGTSNILSFAPGAVQTQLTNFGGLVSGPMMTASNKLYYNWNVLGNLTQAYTTLLPTTGLPVTTGNTRLNPGATLGEFGIAVTDDDHWAAIGRDNNAFNFIQIFVQDLTQPAAPAIQVTSSTEFALSPTWCGSNVLYYVIGGSIGGPFTAMRWDRVSGLSTPLSLTAAKNVPEIHFPTGIPDDGLHMCPR